MCGFKGDRKETGFMLTFLERNSKALWKLAGDNCE